MGGYFAARVGRFGETTLPGLLAALGAVEPLAVFGGDLLVVHGHAFPKHFPIFGGAHSDDAAELLIVILRIGNAHSGTRFKDRHGGVFQLALGFIDAVMGHIFLKVRTVGFLEFPAECRRREIRQFRNRLEIDRAPEMLIDPKQQVVPIQVRRAPLGISKLVVPVDQAQEHGFQSESGFQVAWSRFCLQDRAIVKT